MVVSRLALMYHCARCGHIGETRATVEEPDMPESCGACKSKSWQTMPGSVRLGRRRKPHTP